MLGSFLQSRGELSIAAMVEASPLACAVDHLFRFLSAVPWLASDGIENSGRVACCRFWYTAAAALLHDILI